MILLPRRKLWRDLDRYCAIDVRNPGSGGGSSSVVTDGSLTGDGSAGSPLSVAGTPVSFFTWGSQDSYNARNGANQVSVSGFLLPVRITFGHLILDIFTDDATNNYDAGIYSVAGSLLAHIGAQTLPNSGQQSFAISGGAVTLNPGLYYFGWTGNDTTALIAYSSRIMSTLFNQNIASSSGGALPASIGAITPAFTTNSWKFGLYT